MIYDTSYGIIPLQKSVDGWKVLLIQQHQNYWTFPKGHPENDETPIDSAKRELKEETGLDVMEILYDEPVKENYIFTAKQSKIHKTVIYFLALVDGTISLQHDEILGAKWVKLSEASLSITFPEAKAVCQQVVDILDSNN
jgi:8-oxo-dGTP pyrophosphatase MutT (NUDIX family)